MHTSLNPEAGDLCSENQELDSITTLPLEELLPHRERSLLLNRVLEGDATYAVTLSTVKSSWPFAEGSGVDSLALVEVAAQTAGISCSWDRIQRLGLNSEQKGWIVAVKKAVFHLAELPYEAEVRAEGKNTINFGGFQEVSTLISLDDQIIAEIVLQLYQTQDS